MKISLRKAALVLVMISAGTSAVAANGNKDAYLVDSSKEIVRSGHGLCWHTGYWTPADAIEGCDGAITKSSAKGSSAAKANGTSASKGSSSKPGAAPSAVPVEPKSDKVSFSADAFFDFDKAVLKPEGKAKLDDLVSKLKGTDIEVIVATGHTDSVGSDAYNKKLSQRRAKAVKAFLVSKGIQDARIFIEGKGEAQPIGDNKSRDGRAKNRRVEVEVVGTRSK